MESNRPKEIKVFDSLRGIYSFFVFFLHCNLTNILFISKDTYRYFNLIGHLAVDGFFFLSGFIITYVYEKKLSDAMQTNFRNFMRVFLKYFANRFARLYPLVFFSVTVAVIINPNKWIAQLSEYFVVCAWTSSCFGNTPLWSLNAEFLLYLLFPLFIWINKRINPDKKIWISILL